MLTHKRFVKLLILLMAASLILAACDRPAPSNNNDGGTQTNENDSGYPPDGEGQAEEPTVSEEPTREVLAEGEGEEGEGGEVEVSAEATSMAPSEGEEGEGSEGEEGEVSEVEVPAEATSAAPSEGEEGEEVSGEEGSESEVEVPAEADGTPEEVAEGEGAEAEEASEAEVPAEATEAEVPAEAEVTGGQPLPATHTVAAGENLYRIGLQYGISWVAIANANGITNPDRIYTGQVLDIPGGGEQGAGGQPDPMPTPEGINYVVKPGDTLFKIAQQFKISWVEIAEANGLVNPNVIYAGQTIKIPVDAPTPPPVVHHVVKPGETLFRISLHYGLPWLAIANANDIDAPYVIYAGQTLVIPGGGY